MNSVIMFVLISPPVQGQIRLYCGRLSTKYLAHTVFVRRRRSFEMTIDRVPDRDEVVLHVFFCVTSYVVALTCYKLQFFF